MDRGYCLKWNKYGTVFQSSFLNLFASQELTDMTFVIDGEFIKCHRIIISAASSYFRNILVNLKEPNPVIVLNDISYSTFRALIDFIYCGEIEVHQSFLGAVVRAGEKYCIEGLKESEESLVNHSLPDEPMNISGEPCPKMYKYNINRDFEEEVENEQNLTSHHEIDETYEEDEQRKAITVDIGQSTLDDPAAVKEETHLVEEESLVQESETNLSVVENPDASSSVYSQDISFSTPVYGQELQSNDHSGERVLELCMGAKFKSFLELKRSVHQFCLQEGIRVFTKDSVTIKRALTDKKIMKKALKCDPRLMYYKLEYSCVQGGKKYKRKSSGERSSSTLRVNCPFTIKINSSEDGKYLVVQTLRDEHNHAKGVLERIVFG
ncbi:modifier of mdg4-like isoform X3 [Artemia franciscana]|uniref:modifier of mdg4-like isoform X3 n=1 Tax=Artemia franciscana TaxID=6661 RepID=UPI0032DA193A